MSDVQTLKISELIAQLEEAKAEHGDLPVSIQGCDCSGAAIGVKHYPASQSGEEQVEIARGAYW